MTDLPPPLSSRAPGPGSPRTVDPSLRTPYSGRWVDLVLGLAMVAVVVTTVLGESDHPSGIHPVAYLLATVFGVCVVLRRRAPRTVLACMIGAIIVYYAFDLPLLGVALPAFVALYTAAELGLVWWAILAALVLLTSSVVFRVVAGARVAERFGYDVLTDVALAVAAISLGLAVRQARLAGERAQEVHRLGELERELEADRRIMDERVRISHDLHESVGNRLAAAMRGIEESSRRLPDDPHRAAEALDRVGKHVAQGLRELHETVRVLRDESATETDVIALTTLADVLAQLEAARIDVDQEVDLEGVHGAVANGAYRIVQEAATRILRRGSAQHVRIRVGHDGRAVHVLVEDDSRGASATEPGTAVGLRGVRERVRGLGGTLRLEAVDGGGVRIRAELPYRGGLD